MNEGTDSCSTPLSMFLHWDKKKGFLQNKCLHCILKSPNTFSLCHLFHVQYYYNELSEQWRNCVD